MAMGAPPPPLTLRDFLELACDSSCSDGFRSYPRRLLPFPVPSDGDPALKLQDKLQAETTAPVRLLIESDLRRSPSRTLSSLLFPRSPRSLAAISRLSRSLSRRLVFWRRHRDDYDDYNDGSDDDSDRDSLGLPSPVVSSCSASDYAESEAPDRPPADEAEDMPSSKPLPSSSTGSVHADDGATAAGDGHKEQLADDGGDAAAGSTEEDKQQLSPVSIMDFPFHDDDERSDAGTCSPATSFQHCLPDPERSSKAHGIRRLDGLARAVDPVDLETHFGIDSDDNVSGESDDAQPQTSDSSGTSAATTWSPPRCRSTDREAEPEPEEEEPRRLLARLLKDDDDDEDTAVTSGATERLLLDFFAEGLDRRRSSSAGPVVGMVTRRPNSDDESALVRAAQEWVQGGGARWGVEDVLFAGEEALAEMERGRRWVCVAEEEREVGAAVERLVMDALVAELVRDLALAARC